MTYRGLTCRAQREVYTCGVRERGDFSASVSVLTGNLLVARLYTCALSLYVTAEPKHFGIMLRGNWLLQSYGGHRVGLCHYSTAANTALVRSHNGYDRYKVLWETTRSRLYIQGKKMQSLWETNYLFTNNCKYSFLQRKICKCTLYCTCDIHHRSCFPIDACNVMDIDKLYHEGGDSPGACIMVFFMC